MALDKKALLKITGNALTPDALKEVGLERVPVTPSGEIAEEVLKRYVAAGQPAQAFFERHKLVTPDEWQKMRHAKPVPTRADPVTREAETEAVSRAWDALAPIKVLGGGTVSAADLVAYAADAGLLSGEVTSTIARMMLPKGTAAVDPPEILDEAAMAWVYDPVAQDRATKRRTFTEPVITRASSRPIQGSEMGASQKLPSNAAIVLQDLFLSLFSMSELSRLVSRLPRGSAILSMCPEPPVSPTQFSTAVADNLVRNGMVDHALFDALLEARPRRGSEISQARSALLY